MSVGSAILTAYKERRSSNEPRRIQGSCRSHTQRVHDVSPVCYNQLNKERR